MTFAPNNIRSVNLINKSVGYSPTLECLATMLTYCRPAFSDTEELFIQQFIMPHIDYKDDFGNLIKKIPMPDGSDSEVMWSCHTDTVHYKDGFQQVVFDKDNHIKLHDKEKEGLNRNCLGADCTTGVWMMLGMIQAEVPGLYIFHRAEEIGAPGSRYIVDKTPELVENIYFAIALDRRGYDDVITHQFGRCCSDEFATSLATAIDLGDYVPDPTGLFTDTANYVDLIPECTNISIGYYRQHSSREGQDALFALWLLKSLIMFDESMLDCSENNREVEVYHQRNHWNSHYDYGYDVHREYMCDDDRYLDYFGKDENKSVKESNLIPFYPLPDDEETKQPNIVCIGGVNDDDVVVAENYYTNMKKDLDILFPKEQSLIKGR